MVRNKARESNNMISAEKSAGRGVNSHSRLHNPFVSRNIHQLALFAFFPPSHSRGLFVFQRLRQFWFRLVADDIPIHVHASRESSEDTAALSPVRRTGCLPALAGNTPHRRRFRLLRKCFSSRHRLRRTEPCNPSPVPVTNP